MTRPRLAYSRPCDCAACPRCRERSIALGEERLTAEVTAGKQLPPHWRGSLEDMTRRAWAELLPPEYRALWVRRA